MNDRSIWLLTGCFVKLKGKTRHGKNRIHEHGDVWLVLGLPEGVINATPMPTWPAIKSDTTGESRWFDPVNFEFEVT